MVAFALIEGHKNKDGEPAVYDEYDISDRLKEYHWQMPAYTLPENAKWVPNLSENFPNAPITSS